jgi:hypothetical protein
MAWQAEVRGQRTEDGLIAISFLSFSLEERIEVRSRISEP